MRATQALENKLKREGNIIVAGIDEVGRGALAGPIVSAVVVLPNSCRLVLKDSKLLSQEKRIKLAFEILNKSLDFGLGLVNNREIDKLGITAAIKLCYLRTLEDLNTPISRLIIDGKYDYLSEFTLSLTTVKADKSCACVAAASIMAKVYRDEIMRSLTSYYEDYDFGNNVGYGTKKHLNAIYKNGLSDLHRKTFKLRTNA
ncbi:MAG: ribonuclease HII [bacterium]|nr:ribonuclease HII [bacterium]